MAIQFAKADGVAQPVATPVTRNGVTARDVTRDVTNSVTRDRAATRNVTLEERVEALEAQVVRVLDLVKGIAARGMMSAAVPSVMIASELPTKDRTAADRQRAYLARKKGASPSP